MEHEVKKKWYNRDVPDAVIQWIGAAMSLFSIVTACLTIGKILQTDKFAWAVLIISIFGLIGPFAFLRDKRKWRIATCIFAFAVFVFSLMIVMDWLVASGFQDIA